MADALTPLEERRETLSDVIYSRVYEAIVTRELAPGTRITESGIASKLNVSKTPVREVLLRLREIGLVKSDGGRVNRVASPSTEEFERAYEFRRVLESFTAKTAAERADGGQLKTISRLADQSLEHARNGDSKLFHSSDRAFHEAIAESAGNPRISRALQDVIALLVVLKEHGELPGQVAYTESGEAHVRIAKAIAAGRADEAQHQLSDHLSQVETYLRGASAVPRSAAAS